MAVRVVVRSPVLRLRLTPQLDHHDITFSDHVIDCGDNARLELAEYGLEKSCDKIALADVCARVFCRSDVRPRNIVG